MSMTVAVLGARGRLGRTAAEAFRDAGHEVIAVVRPGKAGDAPKGTRPAEADIGEAAALTRAVGGAEVIVNAVNPPYTDWAREVPRFTGAVVEALRATGATQLFAGNVYGYGEGMPAVLTATTPEAPTSRKGAIRVEAEAAYRRLAESGGPKTAVVRAGDFYGGGPGSWFDLVIAKDVAKGRFGAPGPLDAVHAWAYLPDLARAFVAVAEAKDRLAPFSVLPFAGHTVTLAAMKRAMEAALGRELKASGIPWWLLKAGGLVVPMWRELAEMEYLWRVPHRLDGTALEAITGPQASTPFDAAIADALAALGHGARTVRAA